MSDALAERLAMKMSLLRFTDEQSDRMIELTMREAWALADHLVLLVNELVAEARDAATREYQAMDERHLTSCIWIDPGRQTGTACFGGTRVPVDPFMDIAEQSDAENARAVWPSVTEAHVAAGKLWRSRYHDWMRGS